MDQQLKFGQWDELLKNQCSVTAQQTSNAASEVRDTRRHRKKSLSKP